MSLVRSRFVDFVPNMSQVELGPRDLELFALLTEFPYLPLPYIAELLGAPGRTYLQRGKSIFRYPGLRARLTRLRKDGGYLRCPPQSWQAANSRYRPAVYALAPKARTVLREHQQPGPVMPLGNDFAHDLGSCLVAASFRIGVSQDARLRFIPAREILAHPACPAPTRASPAPFDIPVTYTHGDRHIVGTKSHDWVPWGIGARLTDGRERRIFFPGFEFDRSTEPLETADAGRASLQRHLLSILALLEGGYRAHFGLPAVFVPIITIGEARMRSIMRLVLKLTGGLGSKYILFKHVDDFASFAPFPPATGHILTEPWERVGSGPYSIVSELQPTS
jgi:hypothetical protein